MRRGRASHAEHRRLGRARADTIRKSFEKVEHLKMGEINLAMSDLSAADAREINGVIEYVVGQLTPPALKSAKPKGKSLQNNPQKPLR